MAKLKSQQLCGGPAPQKHKIDDGQKSGVPATGKNPRALSQSQSGFLFQRRSSVQVSDPKLPIVSSKECAGPTAGDSCKALPVPNPCNQSAALPSSSAQVSAQVAHQVLDDMPKPGSGSPSSPDASATLGSADSGSSEEVSDASNCKPNKETGFSKDKPWVSLFKDNRAADRGFSLEFDSNSADYCTLNDEDIAPVSETWGPTLIGYIAGKFPGRQAISQCCNGWVSSCEFTIHRSGWLIFRFDDEASMNKVLDNGPYFIFHRPLLLKVMPPFFHFDNQEMSRVPVWVKLNDLPPELWNARAISKILSRAGKPLRTDGLTASRKRLSFARALVEIDAAKEPIEEVYVKLPNGESYAQEIVYEFIPEFCTGCMAIGHGLKKCKFYLPTDDTTEQVSPAAQPIKNFR